MKKQNYLELTIKKTKQIVKEKTHLIYTLLSSILVLIFIFSPAKGMMGHDEGAHTEAAFAVSRVNIFNIENVKFIPNKLQEYLLATDKADELYNQKIYSEDSPFVTNFHTYVYNPILYIPAAVGFKIASLFNQIEASQAVLIAKITNAIAGIAIISFSIFILQKYRWRWLIFIVGLTPTCILQLSFVSADTLSIAIVFLFIATIVRLMLDKKYSKNNLKLLIAVSLLLTITRGNNIIFLLLLFAIPNKYIYKEKSKAILVKFLPIVFFIIISIIISIVKNKYGSGAKAEGSFTDSILDINTIVYNFITYNMGHAFFSQFSGVANAAYYNVAPINIVSLPIFAVIVIVGFYCEEIKNKLYNRYILLTIILFAVFIQSIFLMLSHPEVSEIVMRYDYKTFGIQGRYYIYIIPLIAYILARYIPLKFKENSIIKNNELIIFGSIVFISSLIYILYSVYFVY